MTSAETQIAGFFAKYDPATAKLGKALRARLRDRLPGLLELVYVYESQGSLVLSYSPTEAGSDAVCAVAIYPGRVNLCLSGGPRLSASDPKRLLQGRGKTVRHVEVASIADFERPEIDVLLAAAVRLAQVRLDPNAEGSVIVKAGAQRQRALRAKKAARPATRRRKANAPR